MLCFFEFSLKHAFWILFTPFLDILPESGDFPGSGSIVQLRSCLSGDVFSEVHTWLRGRPLPFIDFSYRVPSSSFRIFVLTYPFSGQGANCLVLCSCFQMSEEISELHKHDFYSFEEEILNMAKTKNPTKPQKRPAENTSRELVIREDPANRASQPLSTGFHYF